MTKAEAMAAHPEFPWLNVDDARGVEGVLRGMGVLAAAERVAWCAKAGEGNMNLTLRVRLTGGRSVIVKQARPWVEKYDFIPAPWDRAISEERFYRRVAKLEAVSRRMPRLLGSSAEARALALEDLGEASDLTGIYMGMEVPAEARRALVEYLRGLHAGTRGTADPQLANREMRALNHQHMYVIPLQAGNGLDLSKIEPSLVAAAEELRQDRAYVRRVEETGERYLRDGACLVHGDFFPGSWLRVEGGVRVIDPEFSYYGDPEFDLGVMVAHLRLAGRGRAEVGAMLEGYGRVDEALLGRYAGCEVMRRLIGYAQLPLPPGAWRADVLRASRRAVMEENVEAMWQQ